MKFTLGENLIKIEKGYIGIDLENRAETGQFYYMHNAGKIVNKKKGVIQAGSTILFATAHLDLFAMGVPLLTESEDIEAEILFQNTAGPKMEESGYSDRDISMAAGGFIEGYDQAREKYGFSKDDLEDAYWEGANNAQDSDGLSNGLSFERYLREASEKEHLIQELELESEGKQLVVEDGSVIIENIKYY